MSLGTDREILNYYLQEKTVHSKQIYPSSDDNLLIKCIVNKTEVINDPLSQRPQTRLAVIVA